MPRFRWTAAALCLASVAAVASPQKPSPVRADLWGVDPLTKILRSAVPPSAPAAARMDGARGEVVSGQLAFRADAAIPAATASVTALARGDRSIPAARVRLRWERFIDISRNSEGVPEDELVAKFPASIPDPFWESATIPVAAGATQPLWIEAEIPVDAAPGEYAGTVTIRWKGGSASLPLTLTVFDFEMPAARGQQVTNWFVFPGVGYDVKRDSPEWWALAAKFARAMAAHRQTCFKADLADIETVYDPARGFVCDFRYLDRWAETFFGAGLERLELFQAGRATEKWVDDPACRVAPADLKVAAPPGVELTAEQKLRGVLAQVERHVGENGWRGRVMIHVADEPFMHMLPTYAAVARIVREAAPSLRIIEAVEATGFDGAVDVLVPKLNHLDLWRPSFEREKAAGREVWFYTCCHPWGRYPNRFLDLPLVKTRALHWIEYLYGLDGYLHWGLNFFAGTDPYSEAGISEGLPLGDRAIMYPGQDGPVGSLRWSAMRDGLQDYEYLLALQRRVEALKANVGTGAAWIDPRQRPLELCRRVVSSFYEHTRRAEDLLAARRAIAREIEEADRPGALYVQTEPPEGTAIPEGPRWIIVRGVAAPGAVVTVNGAPATNVGADGTFASAVHLKAPAVTIEAAKDGITRTAARTFKFVD